MHSIEYLQDVWKFSLTCRKIMTKTLGMSGRKKKSCSKFWRVEIRRMTTTPIKNWILLDCKISRNGFSREQIHDWHCPLHQIIYHIICYQILVFGRPKYSKRLNVDARQSRGKFDVVPRTILHVNAFWHLSFIAKTFSNSLWNFFTYKT